MTTDCSALLAQLTQLGVRFTLSGERISYPPSRGTGAQLLLKAIAGHRAELVELLRGMRCVPPAAPLPGDPARSTFPLSDVQRSFWELEQAIPGSLHSNLCRAFHIRGRIDPSRLRGAFAIVVRRHPALRTGFHSGPDGPFQRIEGDCRVEVEFDQQALRGHSFSDRVLETASGMFHRSFELSSPPLLHAALLSDGPDDHVLILVAHHIICDGVSLSVVVEDILRACGAPTPESPTPTEQLRFGDLVVWQQDRLDRGELDPQRHYWAHALARGPHECVGEASAAFSIRTARLPLDFGWNHHAAVRELARAHRCTNFAVLAALYGAALARLFAADEVSVATIVATRLHGGTERMVAPLINTVVLRASRSDGPSVSTWIERYRSLLLGALDNVDLPFSTVADDWSLDHGIAASNMCRAMIILEPARAGGLVREEGAGLECQELPIKELFVSDRTLTSFDLTLTIEESAQEIKGMLTYKTELYSRRAADEFARQFTESILAANRRPDAPVSSLVREKPVS